MVQRDQTGSTYDFDGARMDLAEEFRDNLRGPYSAELQKILDRMRTMPLRGRYAVIVEQPYRLWSLARLSGERGVPPMAVPGVRYTSLAEAEWDIFKRRWRDLSGVPVTVGDPAT